ncbi:hypothetical protein SCHPADRAFT_866713 [Schizopora paradoxa]|uniref:Uncharacterized protein n=1 Tax=Schizopora paradoxa TaxID=27342 RepID=A0A0H2S2X4_9AGAM|nr:hypothetical protein SCHPADRAFT_866713 [Schizopora paradoxa]
MDVDEGGDEEDGDGVQESTPAPRGRGRGRGRGRARGYVSTGRPRGRPRGSGRGRGRGRGRGSSVLLKVSRRGADSDGTGDVDGDADDSQAATPGADDIETSEPVAGGKPFRRIQGQVYVIENDEFITDNDPKGDEKIDENGNLLGGRVFKAQTFILPGRHPERKYMLAIEAARTSGFRDSLYYFRRNLLALKLNATQPEKDFLIDLGKLGGHLRTRSVTLITARSAYKLHGAKMIVDGKLVLDDYYEEKVLAEITPRGLKAGDPASILLEQQLQQMSEAAALLQANKAANANKGDQQRSGLGLYRTGGPTTVFGGSGWGPFSEGPLNVAKKAMLNREGANEENWMSIMAERTADANSEWSKGRREALKALGGIFETDMGRSSARPAGASTSDPSKNQNADESSPQTSRRRKMRQSNNAEYPLGIYEPHSSLTHYRVDTQPTKARWEAVPGGQGTRTVLGGTKTGNGAWALAWVDTVMEFPKIDDDENEQARVELMRDLPIDIDSTASPLT